MATTKTISNTIYNILEEWIQTLPKNIRQEVRDNIMVAGGSIVSLLRNEKINDLDVYFISPETCENVLKHYLTSAREINYVSFETAKISDTLSRVKTLTKDDVNMSRSNPSTLVQFKKNKRYEGKPGIYMPLFLTENALTLTNGIQLITRFVGAPSSVTSSFDFVHPTSFWTYRSGLQLAPAALESILTNTLKLNNVSTYPIAAYFRLRKFMERGWYISAGEMLKLAFEMGNKDLTDVRVLQEQLIGVDLLLFTELVEMLKKHDGPIDNTVVIEYIDKVFDGTNFEPEVKEDNIENIFPINLSQRPITRRRDTY